MDPNSDQHLNSFSVSPLSKPSAPLGTFRKVGLPLIAALLSLAILVIMAVLVKGLLDKHYFFCGKRSASSPGGSCVMAGRTAPQARTSCPVSRASQMGLQWQGLVHAAGAGPSRQEVGLGLFRQLHRSYGQDILRADGLRQQTNLQRRGDWPRPGPGCC